MGVWSRAVEALKLEPTFGVKAWAKTSTCDDVHPHGPMPSGTRMCCMACHSSGRDGHPVFEITATDKLNVQRWQPEDGHDQWSSHDLAAAEPTKYEGTPKPEVKLTREQWRDIQFGRATPPPGYELDDMKRGYIRPISPFDIERQMKDIPDDPEWRRKIPASVD